MPGHRGHAPSSRPTAQATPPPSLSPQGRDHAPSRPYGPPRLTRLQAKLSVAGVQTSPPAPSQPRPLPQASPPSSVLAPPSTLVTPTRSAKVPLPQQGQVPSAPSHQAGLGRRVSRPRGRPLLSLEKSSRVWELALATFCRVKSDCRLKSLV